MNEDEEAAIGYVLNAIQVLQSIKDSWDITLPYLSCYSVWQSLKGRLLDGCIQLIDGHTMLLHLDPCGTLMGTTS